MKFISYCFKTFSPAVSKFLVVTGLSLSFASCQWGDQVDAFVQPNPDDFTALFSDTNSVTLSTLVTDSMMTGSVSRQLVGRFIDPFFGKMKGASFIQPGFRDAGITLPEGAVYDSLVISLRYNGYYYGDTTKLMNLSVHVLKEDMMDKNAYYSGNSTPYEVTPVGKANFYPKPRPRAGSSSDQSVGRLDLNIRLSDVLGKKIFDLAKSNQLTNNAQWVNMLKGFAILPAEADNNAVIGFITRNTTLKIYHHRPAEVEGITKDSVSVQLVGVYNQIVGDRTGTILAKLPSTYRTSVPSSEIGNMSFIQAGTGIMTRVDLPGIRQFRNLNYMFANSARLVIDPLRNSVTRPFYLPQLYVYFCDKNNDYILSSGRPLPLTDQNNAAVVARLEYDYVNDRQYYTIDVSQYVRQIIQNESEQTFGLLLRPFPAELGPNTGILDHDNGFSVGFDRVVFGDQKNPNGRVKLEIKYTSIKTQ